ncbi:hypothetical protein [Herbiconiux sp.]|uniref:hypothetical protein n=1 Tax=Herbiconiux sp. TaxID=1871186 RepID=UPI0025C69B61|nr:hypothetical protein [Herbiconiux sp.]
MSTVDPIQARERRQAARIGSPAAAVGIVIGLLMILVGAALEMRALFGFAEFDAMGETDEPPLAIVGMVVGLPLLIIGFLVHLGSSRRFTGRLLSAPVVGPVSILFTGLAAGAWWGAFALPEPGAFWLLPIGLSVLSVLSLLLGAVGRARRRSQKDVLAHVLTHGRIQSGVITEIPEIDPSSGGLLGTVTVKFTDATGTDRWVQKAGQWARRDLPATGDPAAVLYDPARPGDTSRIWVAPAGSTTAADFTRWHA